MGGGAVDLGDVTLFVREFGVRRAGRPSLLVLHGGPDIGHSYLVPGLEPLAHDHHAVIFDFRGCGRSSRGLPEDALQPEYVIDDAHRLIDRLGLGRVDLLGFSTGGRAATAFVQRHPEQVRRLVLASTSAYPSPISGTGPNTGGAGPWRRLPAGRSGTRRSSSGTGQGGRLPGLDRRPRPG